MNEMESNPNKVILDVPPLLAWTCWPSDRPMGFARFGHTPCPASLLSNVQRLASRPSPPPTAKTASAFVMRISIDRRTEIDLLNLVGVVFSSRTERFALAWTPTSTSHIYRRILHAYARQKHTHAEDIVSLGGATPVPTLNPGTKEGV